MFLNWGTFGPSQSTWQWLYMVLFVTTGGQPLASIRKWPRLLLNISAHGSTDNKVLSSAQCQDGWIWKVLLFKYVLKHFLSPFLSMSVFRLLQIFFSSLLITITNSLSAKKDPIPLYLFPSAVYIFGFESLSSYYASVHSLLSHL